MINKKLLTIAKLINKNEIVLDVGCDHAYLPIYLVKNKLCKKVIASDISEGALKIASKNIAKENLNIKLYLSDGLNNINENYDCLVISGMGTKSIISILKNKKLCNHIILSSNNNLYELRLFMNKIGYKIDKEKIIYEKGKYYNIVSYYKGKEYLNKNVLLFGKSYNKQYLEYLLKKEFKILKKLDLFKRIKKYIYIARIKRCLKRCN